jgi:hypothetical protein
MAHYTIIYTGWESLKEELGDDFVFFDAQAVSDDNPPVSFPLSMQFRRVISHAEKEIPAITGILENARKYIKAWGPQESALIRELEECGIDVPRMVVKAMQDSFDLEKEALQYSNLQPNIAAATELLKDFQEIIPAMKTQTITYYQLCEHLEKVITDEVVRLYPVLINSSPDCIRNLHSIMVRRIPDLADDLTQLVRGAESNQ